MTRIEETTGAEQSRRVRRARPQAKEPRRGRGLLALGLVLIIAGVAVLAWVGWQFWGTNWVSKERQADVLSSLEDGWGEGSEAVRTDFGRATAILHVPRWGEDYAVPVLEGSSDEVLAAGIGHMEGTADAGEAGNYALAAHRVTHGEPFADFPELRAGDEVIVETRAATYTYVLDTGGTDLIVPFTEGWVLDPRPENPVDGGTEPPANAGRELITLLTCSEIFHTENRSVVFGHLVDVSETGG